MDYICEEELTGSGQNLKLGKLTLPLEPSDLMWQSIPEILMEVKMSSMWERDSYSSHCLTWHIHYMALPCGFPSRGEDDCLGPSPIKSKSSFPFKYFHLHSCDLIQF